MAITKSTYRDVIDDILLDMGNVKGLNYIQDPMYQNWINRVTAQICDEMDIEDRVEILISPVDVIVDVTSIIREVKKIKAIHRLNHVTKRVLAEESRDSILEFQQYDGVHMIAHTAYDAPSMFTFWRENDRRFIEFFPAPLEPENVMVYYYLGFTPRDHQNENVNETEIYLPQEYEKMLVYGTQARIYRHLEDFQRSEVMEQKYEQAKKSFQGRIGYKSRINMSYS